jgi:hypothetical protein
MSFKITGLDDLQREMTLLANVAEALDGDIATLSFDPTDQISIERAIAGMKLAIDQKVSGFGRSAILDGLVAQLKQQYEEEILSRAATARLNSEANGMTDEPIDQTIFRQIENTVSNLRSAEHNTFDLHIKKLSRILHSETLEPISRALTEDVDLEAWLNAGQATQGGMVGTASLDWPSDTRRELGLVILLIDRFAENPNSAMDFSHTFYYAGSKLETRNNWLLSAGLSGVKPISALLRV